MSMICLDIYNHTSLRIPKKLFKDLLDSAERILIQDRRISPQKEFLLELSLVGSRTMTSLNKKYHHKNCVTDVVSLSYFSKKITDRFVGEIFICVPYAIKQAKKTGQSFTEELKFLFVHGLLHAFGYDHKEPIQEAHMKRLAYKMI